jgi:ribonuclease HI
VLKFGKSERLTNSYCPISLLPCLGKVLERIVNNRLYWYVENNNILSSRQSGFRRRCNTTDQIATVEKLIRETFLEKGVCVVVFIDLKGAYDLVNHRLLLQKLVRVGIKGRFLQYCWQFLANRKFQVIYNGELSEIKQSQMGVPQGAAISPLLFNLFLADIPDMEGVTRTEYADDIAMIAKGKSVAECTTILQRALDTFHNYITENRLQINYQKTVAMLFTKKHTDPQPINFDGFNIDYVHEYKYLGVTFDGPSLNFKKHINKIRVDCVSRMNLMKSISNKNWGADRVMLARIYDALVLSKLNYGAEFYSTASKTALSPLDVIQNMGLRIITGAWKTSPIVSLEVESNIPPLHLQRMKATLDYYNRFRNLPANLEVVSNLTNDLQGQMNQPWSESCPPPLLVRAVRLVRTNNLTQLDTENVPLVGLRPPWRVYDEFNYFMKEDDTKSIPDNAVRSIFQDRCQSFPNSLQIFTDASKVSNENGSKTGAAMVVPTRDIAVGCKIPNVSIMSAELYAITMALEWFVESANHPEGIIFSDSLSSITAMKNNLSKKQCVYKHQIHSLITEIVDQGKKINICWIPSHRGIAGNELDDQMAKEAITANVVTIPSINKLDGKTFIRSKLRAQWDTYWSTSVNNSHTGTHFRKIKKEVGYWPWTSIPDNRRMETCLARLRLGHSGLRDHSHRFGLTWSPLCDCGVPETVEHYLIQCGLHNQHRIPVLQLMQHLAANVTMRNLLGGGEFDSGTQKAVLRHVFKFIVDTGKSESL